MGEGEVGEGGEEKGAGVHRGQYIGLEMDWKNMILQKDWLSGHCVECILICQNDSSKLQDVLNNNP